MKILLLSNKSPWPPKDGGAAATLATIKGLSDCGASVTVIALNTLKHFVREDHILFDNSLNAELKLVTLDTATKPLKLLGNLLFSDKPYTIERFESEELKKALSIASGNSFDIIQIEGLAMTLYFPFLKKLTGARIIYRPHNVENQIWRQLAEEEKNVFRKHYFRILASRTSQIEKSIINSFDGIAAMTTDDLEWFKASGLQKPSVVCHAGFPLSATEFNEGKNDQLFFIGSLDWLPNINGLKWFLKNVWPIISMALPDATFHIAGRNPSSRLEEMCRGKGIIFNGEVESSAGFIRDKQVMVVPLFAGSGLRMKIIEGMNIGKSIVATPRAARGLVCHDGKDIFIRENVNEFAGTVISLLGNPSLRKETAKYAMENVRKNYNIFASAEKLMKFYSQLT
jgi:glycosyltransferase involved in cell wall biosynthesis